VSPLGQFGNAGYSECRQKPCSGYRTICPAESGKASVIHNDYKMDNVIFSVENPLQVIGVLGLGKMATVGDPLMDLGCTLGYWVQTSDPEFFS
jgi:aminoglycoside phosphotransferase (APT) family kinase protein